MDADLAKAPASVVFAQRSRALGSVAGELGFAVLSGIPLDLSQKLEADAAFLERRLYRKLRRGAATR